MSLTVDLDLFGEVDDDSNNRRPNCDIPQSGRERHARGDDRPGEDDDHGRRKLEQPHGSFFSDSTAKKRSISRINTPSRPCAPVIMTKHIAIVNESFVERASFMNATNPPTLIAFVMTSVDRVAASIFFRRLVVTETSVLGSPEIEEGAPPGCP